jgi:RNA polymerase sigma-70 factor (ECF subfamily)
MQAAAVQVMVPPRRAAEPSTTSLESEREALARLYRQLAPMIHRRSLALLGDAEDALDAVHDIFCRVQGRLADFRGEAELATWVYRITTNHCLNRLRARRVERRALAQIAREIDGRSGEGPARSVERRDLLRYLLGRFDARKVQIAIHCHYDEMTQAEVAKLLGISERAVRKALKKVTDRLGAAHWALAALGGER